MSAASAPSAPSSSSSFAWQIATVWGIPIVLEISALITLALVSSSYHLYLQTTEPNWSVTQSWITSLVMGMLLYASVLAHELGHSLVALRQGIPVRSIRLFLLGGLATMQRESRSAAGTFQLAVAGPWVSGVIAASCWGLSHVLPAWGAFPCARLAEVNLILGGFNLIPILPLDGGHVLTALIWKFTGNRLTGVKLAALLGQIMGGAAIGSGLALLVAINEPSGLWGTVMGWFLFQNARRYRGLARLQQTLLTLTVNDVSPQVGQWIEGQTTVETFVTTYLQEGHPPDVTYVVATSEPDYPAWLDLERLQALERSQWATTSIDHFTQSIVELPVDLPLSQAILQLDAQPTKKALVRPTGFSSNHEGAAQWMDPSGILVAVGSALGLTLNPADVEQARLTGSYPPSLNLTAVAQALEWIESSVPSSHTF